MNNSDLSQKIATLPAGLASGLTQLVAAAQVLGYRLYLVGGAVRDLILGRPVRDADIVVLGEAITLAEALASTLGKPSLYPAFGTATFTLDNTRLDLSSSRAESYAHPGALPTVRPGTLEEDLRRRDFTINTLAISLNGGDYGRLIDCCDGRVDLKNHLIRALHKDSFADDPTRIWRAVRYELRLGFRIEPDTLLWLTRGLSGLQSITGDRAWYELACLLQEDEPEGMLARLGELGVLCLLSPTLRVDEWLVDKFRAGRASGDPLLPLYLALLTYRLPRAGVETLAEYLPLSKPLRKIIRDTRSLKARLPILARINLKPSTVYYQLHGYAPEAIEANLIASASPTVRYNIELYQHKLKRIKTALTGDDLVALGVPPGPRVGEVLRCLLKARLDAQVGNRAEEIILAKTLIAL